MPVHNAVGVAVVLVAGVGAIGATVSIFRPRILPAVRVYLLGTIGAVAIQALIGLVVFASGNRPDQGLHWLYGAATLLALPVGMAVGRRLGGRDEQIWLAGGAVMTLLFALRAVATG